MICWELPSLDVCLTQAQNNPPGATLIPQRAERSPKAPWDHKLPFQRFCEPYEAEAELWEPPAAQQNFPEEDEMYI